MKLNDLRDLMQHELDDLYSAEKQMLEALPKLADAARSPQLREAFKAHQRQTEGHVSRLEKVYEHLDMRPGRHKCKGMEGLLAEGQARIEDGRSPEVLDAALIAAAQRAEHYEIASYGCAKTYAWLLGNEPAATLLQQTLEEEGATDRKLTQLAEHDINLEALALASGQTPAKVDGQAAPAAANRR